MSYDTVTLRQLQDLHTKLLDDMTAIINKSDRRGRILRWRRGKMTDNEIVAFDKLADVLRSVDEEIERVSARLDILLHPDLSDDEPRTWRHADGSVRDDHMDAQPGDYFG